jgi:hypothetical protein
MVYSKTKKVEKASIGQHRPALTIRGKYKPAYAGISKHL